MEQERETVDKVSPCVGGKWTLKEGKGWLLPGQPCGPGKEEEPRKAERLWRKKQSDLKDGGRETARLGFLLLEMEDGEHR